MLSAAKAHSAQVGVLAVGGAESAMIVVVVVDDVVVDVVVAVVDMAKEEATLPVVADINEKEAESTD